MTTFERIKELAQKRNLTLVEVNDKANLGTRTIYHWKNKQPSNNNLAAVAKVLKTTTDYLNGLTDDPSLPSSDLDDSDLETMLDNARSFDGKPMTPHDREIIKGILRGYYENK